MAKSGDHLHIDGRKIEIPSSRMLYSRVPSVLTDLDLFCGKVAIAVQEEGNVHDHYAVAILEGDTCCSRIFICKISKECYYVLKELSGLIQRSW